ncbi:MAG TPA: ricin-type beta-trefoil lectin domain protein, partial [Candidatus Saccharimonadales bacterium]|nr:ricin-type beta-trefoil lectin domain protein [Candidatus Saccharimonadales bacterium]
RSGVSGDCLDDINNQLISGAPVDNQACNGGDNQNWSVNTIEIKHGSLCLNVIGASQKVGAKVDLNKCNDSPGQVWLNDQNSLFNPNAGLCLSDPASVSGQQLSLGKCDGQDNTKWSSPMLNLNCNNISAEGAKIACYAESDWEEWQAEPNAHPSLLNAYTDGAPYEEWCADFVSYVYNQAGYPFKSAYDGWDENNANNVSNYGFTVHDTSYVPSPGDIGYFDYSGGHVEIVISGGPQPTFIYGNSATIDPTTGNGQMESNTILQDGSNGNITNYYSPTSGS